MRVFFFFLFLSVMSMAQAPPSSGIKVQGGCNQVVTGTSVQVTQVTLNCNGISQEKAAQLVRLLNTIISRQLDPDEVYAQLNQISSKIDSLNVTIAPITAMPQPEQEMFLAAQRLQQDCTAAASDWNRARIDDQSNSLRSPSTAEQTLANAKSKLQATQSAYQQDPSNRLAYLAYVKARNDFLTASTGLQEGLMNGRAAASSDPGPSGQSHAASYKAGLEPRLLKLRGQMLALASDSGSISGPDYDAVSNARDLIAVCQDFLHIGLNAYNSESQRVRNEHAQPGQPRPQ